MTTNHHPNPLEFNRGKSAGGTDKTNDWPPEWDAFPNSWALCSDDYRAGYRAGYGTKPEQVTVVRESKTNRAGDVTGHTLSVRVDGVEQFEVGGKRATRAAAVIVCFGTTWNSEGHQRLGHLGVRGKVEAAQSEARKWATVDTYTEPGAWVRVVEVEVAAR